MSTDIPAPAESIEPPAGPEGATPDEPLGEPGLAALKSEREARAAAEKAAKDALAKVKAFEDAQKTDAEKQAERLAEFERENAELKSAKTRAEVAAAKGVPASLLSGSTQDELEASADALLAFKGETPPQKLIVPGEGKAPAAPGQSMDDWLRQAAQN
ncbi:hypothetical protein ACL9RL_09345 [Plantibacter sp. Mn2098]|uniref:hypothetical protein n=1 Tax=Plantibacter sp. Mn2098 TaxID=3395266 RepID=UPI003BE6A58E